MPTILEKPVSNAEKVRENKLRRMAERQGYAIQKCRRRDPHANDYGGYRIVNPFMNVVVAGGSPQNYAFTLDDVEEWLTSD